MKSNNELSIDLAGNDEVKAILGGLSVGDSYSICITGKVVAVDDQTFTGSIEEIVPEGDMERGEDSPESAKVDHDSPVMILLQGSAPKPKSDGKKTEDSESSD